MALAAAFMLLVAALRKLLTVATKVLLIRHRNALLILGSCYLLLVPLRECLGADILLPLGCPSLRRCLVHPAVYLLNPQVKICQYYLV